MDISKHHTEEKVKGQELLPVKQGCSTMDNSHSAAHINKVLKLST